MSNVKEKFEYNRVWDIKKKIEDTLHSNGQRCDATPIMCNLKNIYALDVKCDHFTKLGQKEYQLRFSFQKMENKPGYLVVISCPISPKSRAKFGSFTFGRAECNVNMSKLKYSVQFERPEIDSENIWKCYSKFFESASKVDSLILADLNELEHRSSSVVDSKPGFNGAFVVDKWVDVEFPTDNTEHKPVTKCDKTLAYKIGERLKKYVFGQDEYIERLALLVQEYIVTGSAPALLAIGKSGSGKTHLIKMLIEKCKDLLPEGFGFKYADCSSLTEHGFTGGEVADIFKYISFKQGIVYLDEIDKILKSSSNAQGENINLPIQTELMNYISGKTVRFLGKEFDTGKLLFVLGGAFSEVYELQENKARPFGFVSEEINFLDKEYSTKRHLDMSPDNVSFRDEGDVINISIDNTINREVEFRNTLIKTGVSKEFVGRIGPIVILNVLSREDYLSIYENNILPKKADSVRTCYNINLEVSEAVKELIINEAINQELGGRTIKNKVDDLVDKAIYPVIEQVYKKTSGVGVDSIDMIIDYENNQYNYKIKLKTAQKKSFQKARPWDV